MSSPRSVGPSSTSKTGPSNLSSASPNLSYSPRVIPNIPPRASFSSSQRPFVPSPSGRDWSGKPTPKVSSDSLKRQAISPPTGGGRGAQSTLTASMAGSSPQHEGHMDSDIPSIPSPAAYDPQAMDSGVSTPRAPMSAGAGGDESGWSSLAEVPDERKAQVLRRHLVSAEERGSKNATPAISPGSTSPTKDGEIGRPGPSGAGNGNGAGDSAVTYGSTSDAQDPSDDPFPIPYDAPGGDVT